MLPGHVYDVETWRNMEKQHAIAHYHKPQHLLALS